MTDFRPVARLGEAAAVHAAPRARPMLRRFEIAFGEPGGGVSGRSVVAPALPPIEETSAAFARGTLMPAEDGPRAIEDLLPGDHLICEGGGIEPILWIGSTHYSAQSVPEGSLLSHLVRVPAEPSLDGVPRPDLLAGPSARMRVRHPRLEKLLGRDTVLAPLTDYVDGDTMVSVRPHGTVQLFHVVLRRHGLIRVGGVALESYHPGNAMDDLARAGLLEAFVSLFPGLSVPGDFGPTAYSRTTRAVIDRLIDG